MKAFFRQFKSGVVALSGGADSAAVLKLAVDFMGRENVKAVTCTNKHVFNYEIENARRIAATLGVSWTTFTTEVPEEFYKNTSRKCYYCKNSLLNWIELFRFDNNLDVIFDGSNIDDLSDDRPGFDAVKKHGVRSPLLETGRGKAFASETVKFFERKQIFFIDESCAATRIKEQPITSELLTKIEKMEDILRDKYPTIRTRIYPDLIKVEFKNKTNLSADDKVKITDIAAKFFTRECHFHTYEITT